MNELATTANKLLGFLFWFLVRQDLSNGATDNSHPRIVRLIQRQGYFLGFFIDTGHRPQNTSDGNNPIIDL